MVVSSNLAFQEEIAEKVEDKVKQNLLNPNKIIEQKEEHLQKSDKKSKGSKQ